MVFLSAYVARVFMYFMGDVLVAKGSYNGKAEMHTCVSFVAMT
jgi:hypothetical protein